MQDCYARLYFISAAGERCEIMLSEREMLVNPITDGKTARLYELRSGITELRDYLFGLVISEPAEEEMKTMTEPTLTLTVPAAWEDIAELPPTTRGLPIWDQSLGQGDSWGYGSCSICRKRTRLRRIPTGEWAARYGGWSL